MIALTELLLINPGVIQQNRLAEKVENN